MWFLRRLWLLLLLPSLVWGQALHQEKVGMYVANKAGNDCSQGTLTQADDNALALGQILVLPPTDRFGNACEWVVSNNITIDSPTFFPHSSEPVLRVTDGVTLTLAQCPITWGDYAIIDANEDTSGTVNYGASCGHCDIDGADDFIHCTGVSGGVVGELSDLTDVHADVTAADEQLMMGDGVFFRGVTWPSCDETTGKVHLDPDTNELECATDASGATTTLDAAFNAGTGEIDSALCGTKTVKITNGGDDFIEICVDASGIPRILGTCDGAGCDNVQGIATDRDFILHDIEASLDMWTIDPDAASPNAMYQVESGYELLTSAEVPLRPAGDCSVAEEAIVANAPLAEWITCADTTGDTLAFDYKIPGKASLDVTLTLTMTAVNKNASPTGTFTLACAAQSIISGTTAYAAHNTTGEQNVSFTTFDTQNRAEDADATITINGVVGKGAHIMGQCRVTAAPAQIADIRLSGTAVIELETNSLSD